MIHLQANRKVAIIVQGPPLYPLSMSVFLLYTWMTSFSKFRTLICFEFILETWWQYEIWTWFYSFPNDYQLSQHHLLKKSYFPQWLYIPVSTNQISMCIHVYFWIFYTLLLFCLPVPIPTSHYLIVPCYILISSKGPVSLALLSLICW